MDKVLLCVGICCIGGAIWIAADAVLFLRGSKLIEGKILRIETHLNRTSKGTSTSKKAVIEYIDPMGAKQSLIPHLNVSYANIGDKVYVAYHEGKQKARFVSLGEVLLLPTFLIMFGLVLLYFMMPFSQSSKIAAGLFNAIGILHN
jgi:hypothetical protein